MNKGLFITLEGIDGAGKSSHLEAVVQWVTQQGQRVIQTREPGGTDLGEQLRNMILHSPMQPMTELLMVFAARAEHVNTLIKPHLMQGTWVVCDRFTDATRAYQGAGRQMGQSSIEQLAHMVHADCEPDLTLIFDIAPEVASIRMLSREGSDRFETEHASFTQRVRQGYLELVRTDPNRCVLIDGAPALHKVRHTVLDVLQQRLGSKYLTKSVTVAK